MGLQPNQEESDSPDSQQAFAFCLPGRGGSPLEHRWPVATRRAGHWRLSPDELTSMPPHARYSAQRPRRGSGFPAASIPASAAWDPESGTINPQLLKVTPPSAGSPTENRNPPLSAVNPPSDEQQYDPRTYSSGPYETGYMYTNLHQQQQALYHPASAVPSLAEGV